MLVQFLPAGNSRLFFVTNVNFEIIALVVDLGPQAGEPEASARPFGRSSKLVSPLGGREESHSRDAFGHILTATSSSS